MVDNIALLSELRGLGSTKTLADIKIEVAKHDYVALRAQKRTKYEIVIWDKVTPINGADPSLILGQSGYNSGEIYLIKMNGYITILQLHDPNGGPMDTVAGAMVAANAQVDNLVEPEVDAQVRELVLDALL